MPAPSSFAETLNSSPTWSRQHTRERVYTHAHTHIYTKQGPPDLKVGPWSKHQLGSSGTTVSSFSGLKDPERSLLITTKGTLGKRHPRATVIDAKGLTVAQPKETRPAESRLSGFHSVHVLNLGSRTYSAKHRLLLFEAFQQIIH